MSEANTVTNGHHRRPVRIANCSGAASDPGFQMYRQATAGPIDAITGDYLAEMNLAQNSQAYRAGTHSGWEPTAEDGLMQTLSIIADKRIKVVINGGALNPGGLAKNVAREAEAKDLNLKIAFVEGDDFYDRVDEILSPAYHLQHLDSENSHLSLDSHTDILRRKKSIVCANAYLGARGIIKALEHGADIVICGRVADASPVIGIAAWWHGWSLTDFDLLASALIAGHFIECSAYLTGGNFCDFERYPLQDLIDVGLGIVEVFGDGTLILTKHESLKGIVNVDTATSQLLYELQGLHYLNSDVIADLTGIEILPAGDNRVLVRGVTGLPPPSTTKLAIFYVGGYQIEMTVNATGSNALAKYNLMRAQLDYGMKARGIDKKLETYEFQVYALPEQDADTQERGTSYCRIFLQAPDPVILKEFSLVFRWFAMQHFHGMHCTSNIRNLSPPPKEFLVYFPALVPQTDIKEQALFVDSKGNIVNKYAAEPLEQTSVLGPRPSHETANSIELASFGETVRTSLDAVVLGRSGDKGGNVNLGLFVRERDEYDWLCSFMTIKRLEQLIGQDWRPEYWIERVEMPKIRAVHFVVYGILGCGVSSSSRLDCLGKGFVDWIRARHVDMPCRFVHRYQNPGSSRGQNGILPA
ncbi:hypothetical protein LTS17_001080 [Exophiala oligosperma]